MIEPGVRLVPRITGREPRPEVAHVGFDKLSKDQQRAYEQTMQLLLGMMRDETLAPVHGEGVLDDLGTASNRVILLDGGRGAGKTTLLRTVLSDLVGLRDPDASEKPRTDTPQKPYAAALRTAFENQRIIVRPVLDLHALPEGTSVLSHIAARLRPDATRSAPWRGDADLEEKVLTSWKRFVRNTAFAWDHTVRRERASDGDAFVREIEQSASSWLNIGGSWRDLLRGLCDLERSRKGYTDSKRPDPFFVLAIDDADMNPERSLETLQVLRGIDHPRLAFILTGDSKLFDSQLRTAFLGRLRQRLVRLRLDGDDFAATTHRDDAIRLAYEFFERVIPPDHRCNIPRLVPEARLAGQPDLSDRLKAFGFPDTTLTLASLLDGNGLLGEALPDRRRALINLSRSIQRDIEYLESPDAEEGGTTPAPPSSLSSKLRCLWVTRRIWRDAVHHSELWLSAQTRLLDRVRVDRAEVYLELRTGGIAVGTEDQEIPLLDAAAGYGVVLHRPVRLRGQIHGLDARGTITELPANVVAAFELVHDVAVLSKQPRFIGPSPLLDDALWMVRAELPLPDDADRRFVTWALPRMRLFDAHYEWVEAVVKRCGTGGYAADFVARSTLLALLHDMTPGYVPAAPHSARPVETTTRWIELFTELYAVISGTSSATNVSLEQIRSMGPVGRWFVDESILLAAPETGLPESTAWEVLAGLEKVFNVSQSDGRSLWGALLAQGRNARARWLDRALRSVPAGSGAAALTTDERARRIRDLDDRGRRAGHPWFSQVDKRDDSRALQREAADQVLALLGTVQLQDTARPLAPMHDTPAGYIERLPRRKRQLQRSAPVVEPMLKELAAEMLGAAAPELAQSNIAGTIADLWERLVGADSVLSRVVEVGAGDRLRLRVLQERQEEPPLRWRRQNGLSLEIVPATMVLKTPGGDPLPDPALPAYQVIWDLAVDGVISADRRTARVTRGRSPVASTISKGSHHFEWPWIPFAALFDLELFDDCWEEIWQVALPSPSSGAGSEGSQLGSAQVGALAFYFIELIREVALKRASSNRSTYDAIPSQEAWRALLDGLFPESRDPGHRFGGYRFVEGDRLNAYREWRARVFVLAAPEFGLPDNLVEIMLAVSDMRFNHEEADSLPAIRRDSFASSAAASAVAAYENAKVKPDHPWVRRFGYLSPPKSAAT